MLDDPFGKPKYGHKAPEKKGEPAGSALVPGSSKSGELSQRPGRGTSLDRPGESSLAAKRDLYMQAAANRAESLAASARNPLVALLFDATGSMGSMIGSVQSRMAYIVTEMNKRLPEQKIDFLIGAWRDYGDGRDVTEFFPVSADSHVLIGHINSIHAHGGGGDDAEAVEAALDSVLSNDDVTLVALAGDEPPHSKQELAALGQSGRKSAVELAQQKQAKKRRPIFTCVVPGHAMERRTRADFAEIAEVSGGQFAALDSSDGKAFAEIVIMAILAQTSKQPKSALERYMKETPGLSLAAAGVGKRLLLTAGSGLAKK